MSLLVWALVTGLMMIRGKVLRAPEKTAALGEVLMGGGSQMFSNKLRSRWFGHIRRRIQLVYGYKEWQVHSQKYCAMSLGRAWLTLGAALLLAIGLEWSYTQQVFAGGLSAMGVAVLLDKELSKQEARCSFELTKHLPVFTMRLLMMMDAGMNVPSAWRFAAKRLPEGRLAEEVQLVEYRMRTGVALKDALLQLAVQVPDRHISRLVHALVRVNELGGVMIFMELEQLQQEMWKDRHTKAQVLIKEMSIRLVFPGILQFAALMGCVLTAVLLGF